MEVIIGSIPVRLYVTAPISPKSRPADQFNNQQQQHNHASMPIGFEDREFTYYITHFTFYILFIF